MPDVDNAPPRKKRGGGMPPRNLNWIRAVVANPPDVCAPFPGYKNGEGYGRVQYCERLWLAHRVAYTLAFGPIPEGLQVNHRCLQSPACCNPGHLYVGTQIENMQDRDRDGTTARGDRSGARTHPERLARGDRSGSRLHPERLNPARGEQNWSAKLTDDDVREIRRRRAAGETGVSLAREFGVVKQMISNIILRKSWAHVE